ncbi:MAG: HAMP domain-containing histidine kinase [Oligoflexia bacterium]|nr:HAMP domain-containing histidine kinase [Oligoflexia bacterium]MBF0364521.1 HAMP domain-containing histidine kinase [Oligoflexia bacterium]
MDHLRETSGLFNIFLNSTGLHWSLSKIFSTSGAPNKLVSDLKQVIVDKDRQIKEGQLQLKRLEGIATSSKMLIHDIRKPFSTIKSVLNILEDLKDDPKELLNAKKDVECSIKHVESMLAEIMDYSREAKLELVARPLDPILKSSIGQILHAPEYQKNEITFNYDLKNGNMPLVDEERLVRALANIIGNAIEAITLIGKKSSGNIWLKSRDTANMLEIIIGNDGPQFAEEDIIKLFEPCFTKGKNKGTGLGLASVRKIISLHGGTISAYNTTDGVEFKIELHSSRMSDCNYVYVS